MRPSASTEGSFAAPALSESDRRAGGGAAVGVAAAGFRAGQAGAGRVPLESVAFWALLRAAMIAVDMHIASGRRRGGRARPRRALPTHRRPPTRTIRWCSSTRSMIERLPPNPLPREACRPNSGIITARYLTDGFRTRLFTHRPALRTAAPRRVHRGLATGWAAGSGSPTRLAEIRFTGGAPSPEGENHWPR